MLFHSLFLISATAIYAEKTVKYAAVIYRHGDRTPINPYPKDPYKNQSLWPVKFGELTNIGKKEHFALGQWLRKRYSHLVSETYDPTEVYIRSTDVDRTLMSAQANLAGFYPPTGNSIWDTDLLWQPIPVHTKPEKDDELLAMKKECIPYNKERAKYRCSMAYKEKLNAVAGLMDYLTTKTGRKIKNFADINDIYNILYIESLYNLTLPKWTKYVYPDKMEKPACFSFATSAATPLMARLMVGPLLKEIVTTMSSVIQDDNPKPSKLSIYSGHDLTIGNILTALNLFDGICPEYTATIFFELLEDNSTAQYFVKVSYRNSVELVEPIVLDIPHCGEICPFHRFVTLYENLVTVDWDYECNQRASIFIAVGFVGIAFTILFCVHKTYFDQIDKNELIPFDYTDALHSEGQEKVPMHMMDHVGEQHRP